MATASTLIESAYRKNRILTPSTTQKANGLEVLNSMINNWSAEGLIIPYTTTESLTLIVGQSSYTIGSAGNFNTTRPLRIINAYIRDSSNVDYPVDVTMSKPEYDGISDKTADARPTRLYYDPQYPLGKIYFDYEPSTAEAFVLVSEKPLTEFVATTTTVTLPLEYYEPIVANLAIRLAIEEDMAIHPALAGVAIASKNTIENINAIDKMMKPVRLDSFLTRML